MGNQPRKPNGQYDFDPNAGSGDLPALGADAAGADDYAEEHSLSGAFVGYPGSRAPIDAAYTMGEALDAEAHRRPQVEVEEGDDGEVLLYGPDGDHRVRMQPVQDRDGEVGMHVFRQRQNPTTWGWEDISHGVYPVFHAEGGKRTDGSPEEAVIRAFDQAEMHYGQDVSGTDFANDPALSGPLGEALRARPDVVAWTGDTGSLYLAPKGGNGERNRLRVEAIRCTDGDYYVSTREQYRVGAVWNDDAYNGAERHRATAAQAARELRDAVDQAGAIRA